MIDYKNIFFTDVKVRQQVMDAWNNQNRGDGWDAWFMDDFQSARWIEKHFNNTEVHWASKWFPRPVLNADLLRYLVTLVEGGVYVDVDVSLSSLSGLAWAKRSSHWLRPKLIDRLSRASQSCNGAP